MPPTFLYRSWTSPRPRNPPQTQKTVYLRTSWTSSWSQGLSLGTWCHSYRSRPRCEHCYQLFVNKYTPEGKALEPGGFRAPKELYREAQGTSIDLARSWHVGLLEGVLKQGS